MREIQDGGRSKNKKVIYMINNKGKMNKNLVLVMMLLLSVGCKAEKIEMSEVPERGFIVLVQLHIGRNLLLPEME